jgi:L-aminopeptidase/D-esterase-like protein
MEYFGSITDVQGIQVGMAQDEAAGTGVTVVLANDGAVCGVDVRGSAPGTRETALLGQAKMVDRIHAVMLAGGSAYGLDAAAGVMEYLEEAGIGFDTGVAKVPIVPAAVIFDLAYKSASIRPDKDMGHEACRNFGQEVKQGSFGAGAGATVGKVLGIENAQKGGVGTASIRLKSGIRVGALMVVNAVGDVVERDGSLIAGAKKNGKHVNTSRMVMEGMDPASLLNTTIGVVATDALLTKDEATKLAQAAHNGLALSISPSHTMQDGDTIFALGVGEKKADLNSLIVACVEAVRRSVLNAVLAAREDIYQK